MTWLLLFISAFAGIGLLLFGIFVLVSNRSSAVNRSFGLFTIALTGWLIANFVGANFKEYEFSLIFSALDFGSGPIMTYLFWIFTQKLYLEGSRSRKPHRALNPAMALLAVTATGLALLPSVIAVGYVDGMLNVEYGPLFALYAAIVAFFAFFAIYYIIKARRGSSGQRRQQLNAMLLALSVAAIFIITSNVIVPQLTDSSAINLAAGNISYLGLLFFLGVTGYATLKHRLFNLRLIVARSFAYLLLVSALTAIYISVVFGLASAVADDDSTFANKIVPILTALVIAGTAPVLRRLFDKVTNHIFYRDAYDPQTFLDQLNKTLVANIEIGILLRHTATVIEENLKAECHIYVKETETMPHRIMGANRMDIKDWQLSLIRSELTTIKDQIVMTDDLGDHYLELKNALYLNNIAVISSLMTSYSSNQEATAYLMLGPKKSGNSYNKQDLRIIDIISDELLIAIQNALRFEEIQTFNITLQNRINEATNKLRRSNEKLKEMDETKDEFISMASHQLRTPLTSVKGYLSMVLDGDAGKVPDDQHQLLNQAYVSAQRMVYLIADLLNVSRLKTGKFMIERTPTNLADMVESEIAQLSEVAKSHKINLNYNKPDDFPILEIDETKTRQVVMNFVDNAIYYTPSGGKIKIELRTDRSSVYFMVKDNGMGVPKSDQPHLFTKFYRARNAQKARPDGTGLGLFMAKKVITEQGGTILFESEEGKGSIFGFKFDKPKEEIKLKADE